MNPVFSIGSYLLMQLFTFLITRWCLKDFAFAKKENGTWRAWTKAVLVIYTIVMLLPVAGAMLPSGKLHNFCQGRGNVFLAFFVYFGGVLLILWLITMIIRAVSKKKSRVLKGICLGAALAAGIILPLYGIPHAKHTIVIDYDVTIPGGEEKDLKIVLISDLHLSVNTSYSHMEKVVDLINAQHADAVLIAGDIFTSDYSTLKDPDKYSALLSTIEAKDGVYAVYGNHDVQETLFGGFPITPISMAFRSTEMEQFMKDCHFNILYDETALIADGAVQIVGRIDGEKAGDGTADRKSPEEVLSGTDPEKPVIVLQHEPVEFAALKEAGADLALCGHTHEGQFFPGNVFTPLFNENSFGYKKVAGLDTIVSAGVGFYGPPMRVGTDSDISVINLHIGG